MWRACAALNVLLVCALVYMLDAQKKGSAAAAQVDMDLAKLKLEWHNSLDKAVRIRTAERIHKKLYSAKGLRERWTALAQDAHKECSRKNRTKIEWNKGLAFKADRTQIPKQACARHDLDSHELCSLQTHAPKVLRRLTNGAVLEGDDRLRALSRHVKPGSRIVEVGTLSGYLRRWMLKRLKPSLLVVMDIEPDAIKICNTEHAALVDEGKVRCMLGDSKQMLSSLDDNSFDLIYIDANHAYDAVCADLEAARDKVKPGGLMGKTNGSRGKGNGVGKLTGE